MGHRCPESMSDARGAKKKEEEERFPSRLLCPRSLPSSLASSLQLKLEQDARTLSSWRCFDRRGPERGEREGFLGGVFFLFISGGGGEGDRRRRKKGPTCKEKRERANALLSFRVPLVLGLDTAALVPGARFLAACHCRRMKRRLDGGRRRAGVFLFDFLESRGATWLRRRANEKRRRKKFLRHPPCSFSLVAAVLLSFSALALFPTAAAFTSSTVQPGAKGN